MATNNITGDALVSRAANDNYRNNWDAIFGKKNKTNTFKDEKELLIAEVTRVVMESGTITNFSPSEWVENWFERESVVLGGISPKKYLTLGNDVSFLVTLIQSSQSNSYL